MNLSVVYSIPIALSVSIRSLSSAQVAGVHTVPRFLIFSKAAIALDGGLTEGNSGVVGTAATALLGPLVVSAAGSMVLPTAGRSFGSYGASVPQDRDAVLREVVAQQMRSPRPADPPAHPGILELARR